MSFYSQYGEDEIFSELLGDGIGSVLELGAWLPTTFSNSRMLIERGWSATLVEFSPAPVRALMEQYGTCPNVRLVQVAVTPRENSLRQFDISDDGLSTADAATFAKWKEVGGYFGKLWVPQMPLAAFLATFGGGYQFVSIDTEGTSIDLAIALLRDCGERPIAMCVEHDERIQELAPVAAKCGYDVRWSNGTNVIISR